MVMNSCFFRVENIVDGLSHLEGKVNLIQSNSHVKELLDEMKDLKKNVEHFDQLFKLYECYIDTLKAQQLNKLSEQLNNKVRDIETDILTIDINVHVSQPQDINLQQQQAQSGDERQRKERQQRDEKRKPQAQDGIKERREDEIKMDRKGGEAADNLKTVSQHATHGSYQLRDSTILLLCYSDNFEKTLCEINPDAVVLLSTIKMPALPDVHVETVDEGWIAFQGGLQEVERQGHRNVAVTPALLLDESIVQLAGYAVSTRINPAANIWVLWNKEDDLSRLQEHLDEEYQRVHQQPQKQSVDDRLRKEGQQRDEKRKLQVQEGITKQREEKISLERKNSDAAATVNMQTVSRHAAHGSYQLRDSTILRLCCSDNFEKTLCEINPDAVVLPSTIKVPALPDVHVEAVDEGWIALRGGLQEVERQGHRNVAVTLAVLLNKSIVKLADYAVSTRINPAANIWVLWNKEGDKSRSQEHLDEEYQCVHQQPQKQMVDERLREEGQQRDEKRKLQLQEGINKQRAEEISLERKNSEAAATVNMQTVSRHVTHGSYQLRDSTILLLCYSNNFEKTLSEINPDAVVLPSTIKLPALPDVYVEAVDEGWIALRGGLQEVEQQGHRNVAVTPALLLNESLVQLADYAVSTRDNPAANIWVLWNNKADLSRLQEHLEEEYQRVHQHPQKQSVDERQRKEGQQRDEKRNLQVQEGINKQRAEEISLERKNSEAAATVNMQTVYRHVTHGSYQLRDSTILLLCYSNNFEKTLSEINPDAVVLPSTIKLAALPDVYVEAVDEGWIALRGGLQEVEQQGHRNVAVTPALLLNESLVQLADYAVSTRDNPAANIWVLWNNKADLSRLQEHLDEEYQRVHQHQQKQSVDERQRKEGQHRDEKRKLQVQEGINKQREEKISLERKHSEAAATVNMQTVSQHATHGSYQLRDSTILLLCYSDNFEKTLSEINPDAVVLPSNIDLPSLPEVDVEEVGKGWFALCNGLQKVEQRGRRSVGIIPSLLQTRSITQLAEYAAGGRDNPAAHIWVLWDNMDNLSSWQQQLSKDYQHIEQVSQIIKKHRSSTMSNPFKETIKSKMDKLGEIDVNKDFINHFVSAKLLTMDECDAIMLQHDQAARIAEFLKTIMNKPEKQAVSGLLEALKNTTQHHLAEEIEEEYAATQAKPHKFKTKLLDVNVVQNDTAAFEVKVDPPYAPITWYHENKEVVENERFHIWEDDVGGRYLEIEHTLKSDIGIITAKLKDDERKAELWVPEMVDTHLCSPCWGVTLMQFKCTRRKAGTVELERSGDGGPKSLQRKWKVLKLFRNDKSAVKVDKWAVNSTITYEGDEEAMKELEMGIQNKMKSTQQLVQFIIRLYKPCTEVKWFKEGTEIMSGQTYKYRFFHEDDGLKHVLEIEDVQNEDEGIYSFFISEAVATEGRDQVIVKGRIMDKAADAPQKCWSNSDQEL